MHDRSIWIGYEPRELDAYVVARHSISRKLSQDVPIRGLVLCDLMKRGLYRRKWHRTGGSIVDHLSVARGGSRMIDKISDAPMSTEFAISRFLTPKLAATGWALYLDCDVLARADLMELFRMADKRYAVMCVKHVHEPKERVKMDDQLQLRYARKNWSSVMLFNCDHLAHNKLTLDLINSVPGRDLHRFCWLQDDEIGELSPEWNYLVGYTTGVSDPKIVHFTNGIPSMQGQLQNSDQELTSNIEYAEEWNETLLEWLR